MGGCRVVMSGFEWLRVVRRGLRLGYAWLRVAMIRFRLVSGTYGRYGYDTFSFE